MIYLDYAATCPLSKEAADAYVRTATEFYGNTESFHDIGSRAHDLLEQCRLTLASFLHVPSSGIYFTSGGTESNLICIRSLLTLTDTKGHIITTLAEHSSISNFLSILEDNGYEVTYLPFDHNGQIDCKQFAAAIRPDTILAIIQHANSELGSIQPIEEVSALCKIHQIFLHCDCVHSFTKVDITHVSQAVDSLAISAHKFYGPKGAGLAYIHPAHPIRGLLPNTSHEKGLRPGTVNLPAIVAMTIAADESMKTWKQTRTHAQILRQAFITHCAHFDSIIYEAPRERQILSTIGMRIPGIEGQYVMLEANRKGFCIATGSACATNAQMPSTAMSAIGVNGKAAKEFFRISTGTETSKEQLIALAEFLATLKESMG
ncbi:IscS subfamily cysteine desulfurase [Cytobacillus kochii]|uniref:IscS subfamily cysteine desulfurase n=1 Tax=Cytobacillus kochii TaxID=859143 RepID=UPI0025A282D4|nr:IscS subfamily cysteine desulfurase [Cytobacillus kochii]MDM5208632.1 IscS subfamily cysteine desulfurase [Cytobacillus kochii]